MKFNDNKYFNDNIIYRGYISYLRLAGLLDRYVESYET